MHTHPLLTILRGPLVYVLSLGLLGVMLGSTPAEGQPFAYVTNFYSNTVSVLDTATNTVVATIPVERGPFGVAITPDGTHITEGCA